MNLDKYEDIIIENNDRYFPGWRDSVPDPHLYWALCLCGEAGELANASKKLDRWLRRWSGKNLTYEEYIEKAKEEMGDMFIYLTLYSHILGFELSDAVKGCLEKNFERFGWKDEKVE